MTDKPSLFGSGAFSSNSGSNLFGSSSSTAAGGASQTGTSLFGGGTGQSSTSGLFGSANSGTTQTSSIFGAATNTAAKDTSSSIFGSNSAGATQKPSPGLFGSNLGGSTQGSTSLFGSSTNSIGGNSTSTLFGGNSLSTGQTSAPSQFGSKPVGEAQKTSSNLFGAATNSGSGLFGSVKTTNSEQKKPSFSLGNSSTITTAKTTTSETSKPAGFSFGASTIANSSNGDSKTATDSKLNFSFGGSGASTKDSKSSTDKPTGSLFGGSMQSSGLFSSLGNSSGDKSTTTTNSDTAPKPSFSFSQPVKPASDLSNSNVSTTGATNGAAKTSLFSSANFAAKPDDNQSKNQVVENKDSSAKTGLFSSSQPTTSNTGIKTNLFTAPAPAAASTSDGTKAAEKSATDSTLSSGLTKKVEESASSTSDPKIEIKEIASDISVKMLESKNLGDIIDVWTDELSSQIRQFHTQASIASKWESQLIEQGKQISKLHEIATMAEADQTVLDQSLDHMEAQQRVLVGFLDKYEPMTRDMVLKTRENYNSQPSQIIQSFGGINNKNFELKSAEEEREQVYNMSEQLNAQLDEMTKCLTGLIEEANTVTEISSAISLANAPQGGIGGDGLTTNGGMLKAGDPLVVIMKILNANLTSLENIESQSDMLQQRLEYLKSVNNQVNDTDRNDSFAASTEYGYDDSNQLAPPVKSADYNIEDRDLRYGSSIPGSRSLFRKEGIAQNLGFASPSLSAMGKTKQAYMSPYSTRSTSLFGGKSGGAGNYGQNGGIPDVSSPSLVGRGSVFDKGNELGGLQNSPFHRQSNNPSTPVRRGGIGSQQGTQIFGSGTESQYSLNKQRRW
ncbi:Nuclear pore glycoprotein p62 [Smittium mucronatum]|uniref:Nuclear pore glycoprotein p62 n=1 Tax=Smittium mucronatum TaxID=133383 RepID=A0A1R0H3M3_9FUNG|nr:Nuclear pore glycoprotein p62 [Smittium mucronatum]